MLYHFKSQVLLGWGGEERGEERREVAEGRGRGEWQIGRDRGSGRGQGQREEAEKRGRGEWQMKETEGSGRWEGACGKSNYFKMSPVQNMTHIQDNSIFVSYRCCCLEE